MKEKAGAADQEEDGRLGAGKSGEDLPAELQRRETRLQKIRMAKRALEERAGEEAKAEGKPAEEVKAAQPGRSRIMMGADGFVQGYNAQAAVEARLQLIVGQRVTPVTNDKKQVEPMASYFSVQK